MINVSTVRSSNKTRLLEVDMEDKDNCIITAFQLSLSLEIDGCLWQSGPALKVPTCP